MLVGIVGKPNVGKTTFFVAATLAPAEIAPYPFTTIEPNRGVGYLRVRCVCRELGVEDQPVNSVCIDGNRLIPVELVDCAGLVPDAWRGRGLGNRFLDEIRRADALIHVVDASGSTDMEGRPCKPGEHDPLEDIRFLEREITMWMVQILKRDWAKLVRRVEMTGARLVDALERRLSGLAIKRAEIVKAIKEAELDPARPGSWGDEGLYAFCDKLRRISKPMLIAANKIDIPTAEENLERLKEAGYLVVPCCAEAELALRRAAEKGLIRYLPGDPDFEIIEPSKLNPGQRKALDMIRERVLARYGSTGVQQAINAAYFDLLGAVTVYPVEDPEKLCDHQGRVLPDAYVVPRGTTARQLAYMIHTELGETFIYAIDARTKRRLGEDYVLQDGDVISIVSARRRA